MKTLRRRLLVGAVIALIALGLTLAFDREARQAFVAPILYTVWSLGLFLDGLPQGVLWAVFLAAALILAWHSLDRPRLIKPSSSSQESAPVGRVATVARWVSESAHGGYFRQRFARYLAGLTLSAQGRHEPVGDAQIVQMLDRGELRLPPATRAYLVDALQIGLSPQPASWLERLWLMVRQLPAQFHAEYTVDPGLEQLVQHLEDELEIRHEHRDR